MSDGGYRVVNSGVVEEQFRELLAEVRGTAREAGFVDSAKSLMRTLSQAPAEFGESAATDPNSRLVFRRGFSGSLFVQYAIDDSAKTVYLRRFALQRGRR